jgi:hypothetical protein
MEYFNTTAAGVNPASYGAGLPHGLILAIAKAAGLELRGSGPKHQLRCPFHPDAHTLGLHDAEKNLFSCSALRAEPEREELQAEAWHPMAALGSRR